MNPQLLNWLVLTPTLTLLGDKYDRRLARVQMTAIALQESGLRERIQIPVGYARGWWQFEKAGGVREVMQHPKVGPELRRVCEALDIPFEEGMIHTAMAWNDNLAASMARLLIYIDPRALPTTAQEGWDQYTARWRPGRPHRDVWDNNWRLAQETIP